MDFRNVSEGSEEFTCNVFQCESLVVDTGEGAGIEERLRSLETVEAVLLTHTHHDHIGHVEMLSREFDPVFYCFDSSRMPEVGSEIRELEDGEQFEAAGREFEAIHTPGHIDDHLCYWMPAESALFSGDLVFADGEFGRTDLEEGDRELLIESIEKVIERTDPETIYPGHGRAVREAAAQSLHRSLTEAKKMEPKY